MGDAGLTKQIRDLRKNYIERLSTTLDRGDSSSDEIADIHLRLDSLDRIQSTLTPSWIARAKPAVVVGIVTALVLTLLASVNARFLTAKLVLHSRTVGMTVHEETNLTGVPFSDSALVEGATWIRSALLPQSEGGAAGTLLIEAPDVSLESLMLQKDGELELERGTTTLRLVARNSPARVQLNVRGNTRIFVGEDDQATASIDRNFLTPEPIRAGISHDAPHENDRKELVVSGTISGDSTLAINAIPESIRFVERVTTPGAADLYSSSIISGTITFAEIDGATELEEGDVLQIDNLQADRGRLSIGSDIGTDVSGTASDIRVRRGLVVKSISPSVLEFLAKNHLVKLLWGSAAFLSGMLWTANRYFSR